MKQIIYFIVGFIFLNTTMIFPAYAYLDAGTGSIILQGLIGAFVAAGLFMKAYWYKLKIFFGLKPPAQVGEDTSANIDYDKESD